MTNMLAHVIVDPPSLTMDDFESWEELDEVTGAAYFFLKSGRLPNEPEYQKSTPEVQN